MGGFTCKASRNHPWRKCNDRMFNEMMQRRKEPKQVKKPG